MTEYILLYPGFARTPGWCHVIVADNGHPRTVLVGDLDDNPGTNVLSDRMGGRAGAVLDAHLDARSPMHT